MRWRLCSLAAAVLTIIGLGAAPADDRRRPTAAPAEPDYSTGPYTASTWYSPDSEGECRSWLGPGRPEPGRVTIGCYVPMIDTIIESWRCDPRRGRRPEAWCAAHHDHELRHARGERHAPQP